jgi:hypothetical protein
MSRKQWVQHRSGDGDKWKVIEELSLQWVVEQGMAIRHSVLPKVEYVICEPPEEWEDVTGDFVVVDEADGGFPGCIASTNHYVVLTKTSHFHKGMRLTKIDGMHNGPAFIIERKKS